MVYLLQKVIKEAVLMACNYMGGFAEICRMMINKEWDEIYTNVMKYIDVSCMLWSLGTHVLSNRVVYDCYYGGKNLWGGFFQVLN